MVRADDPGCRGVLETPIHVDVPAGLPDHRQDVKPRSLSTMPPSSGTAKIQGKKKRGVVDLSGLAASYARRGAGGQGLISEHLGVSRELWI